MTNATTLRPCNVHAIDTAALTGEHAIAAGATLAAATARAVAVLNALDAALATSDASDDTLRTLARRLDAPTAAPKGR